MDDHPKPRVRWRTAVPQLSQFALEHLLLLPLGAAIALIWVNTAPERYYAATFAMRFAVNDVAMVFFFGLMMKEVVEANAPGGVLHPARRVIVPVIAAIGAAAVSALLFSQLVVALDEPLLIVGWPVPFATDLAVTYFVGRLIFGRHAIIPFLLLLAIASAGIGFVALAVLNPSRELHPATGAAMLAGALGLAAILRRLQLTSFWPYLLGPGVLSWLALYRGGLHPALALVPIVPFLPHAARDPGFFVDADPNAKDTLSRFEVFWRYPAQVALFFFGLVNAGVPLGALEEGTWALPIAVVVGKPIGVLVGTGLARAAGLRLPRPIRWRELLVVGLLAAVGFSMGLFFCAAFLPPGQILAEMSMGTILSLLALPLAVAVAWLVGAGRFAPQP